MKMKLLVLIAFLWSVPAVAQVGLFSGNMLDEKCAQQRRFDAGTKLTDTEFGDAMFCIGYIRGVAEGAAIQSKMKVKLVAQDGEWATPCFPAGASNVQYIKVVLKFLADNPEKLHLPAYLVVLSALNQAFPCS